MPQSNAIFTYPAGAGSLVPRDAFDLAAMLYWMFWEQYSHEPTIVLCRFLMVYEGGDAADRVLGLVAGSDAALDQMERNLSAHPWFVRERTEFGRSRASALQPAGAGRRL